MSSYSVLPVGEAARAMLADAQARMEQARQAEAEAMLAANRARREVQTAEAVVAAIGAIRNERGDVAIIRRDGTCLARPDDVQALAIAFGRVPWVQPSTVWGGVNTRRRWHRTDCDRAPHQFGQAMMMLPGALPVGSVCPACVKASKQQEVKR